MCATGVHVILQMTLTFLAGIQVSSRDTNFLARLLGSLDLSFDGAISVGYINTSIMSRIVAVILLLMAFGQHFWVSLGTFYVLQGATVVLTTYYLFFS